MSPLSESLLTAFALLLVLEGILPFVAPGMWREAFTRLMQLSDGQLRFVGLASMIAGVTMLVFVHG